MTRSLLHSTFRCTHLHKLENGTPSTIACLHAWYTKTHCLKGTTQPITSSRITLTRSFGSYKTAYRTAAMSNHSCHGYSTVFVIFGTLPKASPTSLRTVISRITETDHDCRSSHCDLSSQDTQVYKQSNNRLHCSQQYTCSVLQLYGSLLALSRSQKAVLAAVSEQRPRTTAHWSAHVTRLFEAM